MGGRLYGRIYLSVLGVFPILFIHISCITLCIDRAKREGISFPHNTTEQPCDRLKRVTVMTIIPRVTSSKPRPAQGTAPRSINRQLSTRQFIVILVRSFEVRIPGSKCKIGIFLGLRRYFFTTEQIAGTTSNPTPVPNTTKSAVIIDMKAHVLISSPELDLLDRAKTKSTITTLGITILKGSTPMSDNTIHPQSTTSTQKAQMTLLIVPTVTLRNQNEVPLLVLPCVSHMRTGAVAK